MMPKSISKVPPLRTEVFIMHQVFFKYALPV